MFLFDYCLLLFSHKIVSNSCDPTDSSPITLLCPLNFSGKNRLPLPSPGISPTQGLNLHFLHWQALYRWATWEASLGILAVLVAQSCLTFWDSMDCSLPDSSVHGILQARILSGLPFPSPDDLPNPGIEPGSPELQAVSLPSALQGSPCINPSWIISSPIYQFLLRSLLHFKICQIALVFSLKKERKWKPLSCVRLFATHGLYLEFSRPEYWSG